MVKYEAKMSFRYVFVNNMSVMGTFFTVIKSTRFGRFRFLIVGKRTTSLNCANQYPGIRLSVGYPVNVEYQVRYPASIISQIFGIRPNPS